VHLWGPSLLVVLKAAVRVVTASSTWNGVVCPPGNSTVIGLQFLFENERMRGSIPASFSALTGLTVLYLDGSLYQPFPDFSGMGLTRLQTLVLSSHNVRAILICGALLQCDIV
jgi:hypothetical protein